MENKFEKDMQKGILNAEFYMQMLKLTNALDYINCELNVIYEIYPQIYASTNQLESIKIRMELKKFINKYCLKDLEKIKSQMKMLEIILNNKKERLL